MYDYPGEYVTPAEGEHYVRTRLEEIQAQFEIATGSTNARGFCTGSLFKLTGHPRPDQSREYLIVSATHDLEYSEYEAMEGGGTDYRCTFTVLNSREPFRSQRITPKPTVQGPQTAIVVGPQGDEIYTDKYGRVKVQFHWDRVGKIRREQLVLDPGIASLGRQELGHGRDPAHRTGGHRRFSGRRSRPANHYWACLQRRTDAALRRCPANMTQTGHHEPLEQGRQRRERQRVPVRGQEGLGAGLPARGEEPGHRGRERRDALGGPRSDEDDRPRRDDARQARPHRDGRQQRDDHDR